MEVVLRDVITDDLPILFEQQIDPQAVEMAAHPPRDREAFQAHWIELLAKESVIKKTILLDGVVAGYVMSFVYFGQREVGYWIGKEYWGQGVATRALSAFLDQVPVRPLFAVAAKHNRSSLRVLEKCGFKIVAEEKEFSQVGGTTIEGFVLKLGTDQADGTIGPAV
jgi:RimJ/RimL family protein N-acetyltransferase